MQVPERTCLEHAATDTTNGGWAPILRFALQIHIDHACHAVMFRLQFLREREKLEAGNNWERWELAGWRGGRG
jgi:hypothetical protein